jgi:hypothetical protein
MCTTHAHHTTPLHRISSPPATLLARLLLLAGACNAPHRPPPPRPPGRRRGRCRGGRAAAAAAVQPQEPGAGPAGQRAALRHHAQQDAAAAPGGAPGGARRQRGRARGRAGERVVALAVAALATKARQAAGGVACGSWQALLPGPPGPCPLHPGAAAAPTAAAGDASPHSARRRLALASSAAARLSDRPPSPPSPPQGLAHLVEHVTFLGSRKREALLGTGARANAYTDFHHTVFHAHAPLTSAVNGLPMLPQVRLPLLFGGRGRRLAAVRGAGRCSLGPPAELAGSGGGGAGSRHSCAAAGAACYPCPPHPPLRALRPQVLEALEDIAFKPQFLPVRIDKERKAVMAEAQMMNTMEYRVDCQLLQYLHHENNLGCRWVGGREGGPAVVGCMLWGGDGAARVDEQAADMWGGAGLRAWCVAGWGVDGWRWGKEALPGRAPAQLLARLSRAGAGARRRHRSRSNRAPWLQVPHRQDGPGGGVAQRAGQALLAEVVLPGQLHAVRGGRPGQEHRGGGEAGRAGGAADFSACTPWRLAPLWM